MILKAAEPTLIPPLLEFVVPPTHPNVRWFGCTIVVWRWDPHGDTGHAQALDFATEGGMICCVGVGVSCRKAQMGAATGDEFIRREMDRAQDQ